MKKIIALIIFLVALTFISPALVDLSEFVYVKLTHVENPDQPLYEELHRRRYQNILCGHSSNLSSVVKKYIPLGTPKKEVFHIMEHNGFIDPHSDQSTGRISWFGWDKSKVLRREYEIHVDFRNGKVVATFAQEWCFAF